MAATSTDPVDTVRLGPHGGTLTPTKENNVDPDATLSELDAFVVDLHHYLRQGSSRATLSSCLVNIAERAEALDGWIAKGGLLPTPKEG